MPDPQPAWAQQYNAQMQPAWARKFEPASITGGESQGAIRILMDVYRHTGDKKYLAPIPAALDYLAKSEVSAGRLARFYELKTNQAALFHQAIRARLYRRRHAHALRLHHRLQRPQPA